ncbi:MAG: hypothetical protein KJO82_01500, partial [Gammaproteobacteria bacterium]|nr:hypothetical protein [Gammaproteobacteria bacterium]
YDATPGQDISTELNSAFAAAKANGGGDVHLPPNSTRYYLDADADILQNVTLQLPAGAIIEIRNPGVYLRIAENGAWISGPGKIYVSTTDGAAAGVLVRPNDFAFSRAQRQGIKGDTTIQNVSGSRTGKALYCLADPVAGATDAYIEWCVFECALKDFEYGIFLECNRDVGELAFCNGNDFPRVSIDRCLHPFHLEAGGNSDAAAVSGNNFGAVQIEADAGTIDIIEVIDPGGNNLIYRNRWNALSVFDYMGTDAFKIPGVPRCGYNDITVTGLAIDKYTVDPFYTRIHSYQNSTNESHERLRQWDASSILARDPARFKTTEMFSTDHQRRYYSDGAYWHGFDGAKVAYTLPESSIGFDAGTGLVEAGDTITGATSGASAVVKEVTLSSGTWGVDAAGTLWLGAVTSGPFQDNENLNVGGSLQCLADGADSINTSYTMRLGQLSPGRWYQTDSNADATVREIRLDGFNVAKTGAVLHLQRRTPNAPVWVNPGASKAIYDPFTGRNGSAGEKLALDAQYAEVLMVCVENLNWVVIGKRISSGIDFAGASAAPAASIVSEVAGVSYTNNEQDMLNACKTAINEIQIALDKMRVQDRP